MILAFHLEENFIQTLLIQDKIYALEVTTSELDTPFPIKYFVSICRDVNFFKAILPLFCNCGRPE